jgi:hypothetical protein
MLYFEFCIMIFLEFKLNECGLNVPDRKAFWDM